MGEQNRLARQTVHIAEAMGFQVRRTGGDHLAAQHPRGGPQVVFSSTSKSTRGHLNTVAILRRVLRELELPDYTRCNTGE